MRAIRPTLICLLAAAALLCCSCQGRVTSTPQAVAPEPAQASQESAPALETAPSQSALPSQEPAPPQTAASAQAGEPSASGAGIPVGYQEAVEAVLAQHSGAVPLKCSLDYDDGLTLYEIDVLGADGVVYEVQVDAVSGTILRTETDDDGTRYTREMIAIPYAQAVSAAMDSMPGCSFESFEIDTNIAGTVVYEVEVLDSQRWEQTAEVDASTGALVAGSAAEVPPQQPVGAAQTPGTGGAVSGHHQERHHNTAQAVASPLAENMIITSQSSLGTCGRCGRYPCVCSSSGSTAASCGTCGQSPCVCPPAGTTAGGKATSAASAACGTCGRNPCVCSGVSRGGHHAHSGGHHSGRCG